MVKESSTDKSEIDAWLNFSSRLSRFRLAVSRCEFRLPSPSFSDCKSLYTASVARAAYIPVPSCMTDVPKQICAGHHQFSARRGGIRSTVCGVASSISKF